MNFSLIESTHTYLFGGREIPGCTRCLDHCGLVDFRFVREEILAAKSRLGIEVHRAIQYFVEGDLDFGSIDDDVMGYLRSWIKLQEQTRFIPQVVEKQIHSTIDTGLQYGMKVDLAGKFAGDDAILDLKTGKAQWYHGVQLAGYAIGLPHADFTSSAGRFAKRKRYVVELRADGQMAKVVPFTLKRDLNTFLAALEITSRKMAEGKKIQPLEEVAA